MEAKIRLQFESQLQEKNTTIVNLTEKIHHLETALAELKVKLADLQTGLQTMGDQGKAMQLFKRNDAFVILVPNNFFDFMCMKIIYVLVMSQSLWETAQ